MTIFKLKIIYTICDIGNTISVNSFYVFDNNTYCIILFYYDIKENIVN